MRRIALLVAIAASLALVWSVAASGTSPRFGRPRVLARNLGQAAAYTAGGALWVTAHGATRAAMLERLDPRTGPGPARARPGNPR